jgi:predicted RNase H-like HicB family nuclease
MPKKSANSKSLRLKPEFVARARPIADKYQMIICFEDGEYYGRGVELPFAFGDAKTIEKCAKNTREGFIAAVASMLQDGQVPPAPASEGNHTKQIDVRLSMEQKLVLQETSHKKGFRGNIDSPKPPARPKK